MWIARVKHFWLVFELEHQSGLEGLQRQQILVPPGAVPVGGNHSTAGGGCVCFFTSPKIWLLYIDLSIFIMCTVLLHDMVII